MNLIHDLYPTPQSPKVATIGFFDGVHTGHRFLLEQVKREARARGVKSAVVTFPASPAAVMHPEAKVSLLNTPFEKLDHLERVGVDECVMMPFTPELAALTARQFMQLLKERYGILALVIGYDHRFGHNRSEGFDDYVRYGRELGVEVVQATEYDGAKVSSSAIRRLLAEGQMEPANRLLGYTYYIEGVVTEGYQMGRRIGFPTANLLPDEPDKLVPADGVYAVRVQLQCNWWNGVLNIGHRPTLHNGPERSIEVHLLDFKGDVYALPLRIEFLHYLRREQMFASVEELAGQIELDKQQAKQYFIVNEDI
jgi:riboflavin kinase/FMN adenylyltransferase